MAIAEELQELGRMSFRQLLMILLAGLVVGWLVSQIFSVSVGLVLYWLLGTDVEAGTAFLMGEISQYAVTSLGNVVGVFAGLWVGYTAFCRFKKVIHPNVDNLEGLGQMTVRQIGMILLSGVLAWWLMSASLKLALYSWHAWPGSDAPGLTATMVIHKAFVVAIANPIIGWVSPAVGLCVGYITFRKYKSHLEADFATEGSTSH